MKTIVTANRRGGAGKTVTAFALGAGLSRKGYSVLFIDLDSQASLSWDIAADPDGAGAMEILTGAAPIRSVIQHLEKWDAISPGANIEAADLLITGSGKEYRLRNALSAVGTLYDYCIIDTPPALNIATVNALTAADGLLITAQPERHSIQGIALLYDIIQQIQRRSNPNLDIYGIVITRYTGNACLSRDMKSNLDAIAARLETKLYSPIRECVAVKESEYEQRDIFSYPKRYNAVKDYQKLLEDLLTDMEGRQ